MRIIIVGTTGSGKSTLARQIAAQYNIPHIEYDALNFAPNWQAVPLEDFRANVDAATNAEAWVADGNYSGKARDITWPKATHIIWLDYPMLLNFWRLLKRTLRRVFLREELWAGNRETLWQQLNPKHSIIVWFFKSYKRRRRDYSALMAEGFPPQVTWLRLQHPKITTKFVQTLPADFEDFPVNLEHLG